MNSNNKNNNSFVVGQVIRCRVANIDVQGKFVLSLDLDKTRGDLRSQGDLSPGTVVDKLKVTDIDDHAVFVSFEYEVDESKDRDEEDADDDDDEMKKNQIIKRTGYG